MTIRVTIKHEQPDYERSITVQTVNPDGEPIGPNDILAPGDSRIFYVWQGQSLVVREMKPGAEQ